MFYSAENRGFYSPEIHDEMPADAVEISDEAYLALLEAQGNGQEIVPGPDGLPVAQDRPEPPPTVPRTVTNFQARAAMMQVPGSTPGTSLFSEVDAAIRAGKDSGPEGAIAFQAWEFANDFYRDGALINALGAGFGQSQADIDALFIAASTIEA